jgi:histone deacetylase complex regulatory component SIN3
MCHLWIDCSIGVIGIMDRMKVLLCGYPDLKRRFNMFLPTQYELSLRDDD